MFPIAAIPSLYGGDEQPAGGKRMRVSRRVVLEVCEAVLRDIERDRDRRRAQTIAAEQARRQRWNAHWWVPRFLALATDADSIEAEFRRLPAIDSPLVPIVLYRGHCYLTCLELRSAASRASGDGVKLPAEDWTRVRAEYESVRRDG